MHTYTLTTVAFLLILLSIVIPISLTGGISTSSVGITMYLREYFFKLVKDFEMFWIIFLLSQSFIAIKLASGKVTNA